MTETESFIDRLLINSEMNGVDYLIEKYELNKRTRLMEKVIVRQYFSYMVYHIRKMSLTDIGLLLNQKHCTIYHSIKEVENKLRFKDRQMLEVVKKHETEFKNVIL